MSKGLFTALSGAMAQSQRLDTIANNLANTNTAGFKRDAQLFREYLTAFEKEPGGNGVQPPTTKVPDSVESFYELNGADKSFVDGSGTFTDFTQGSVRPTGNNWDLAIEGEGFFEVATPSGPLLTRAGNFTLDAEGRLVTKQGHPVMLEGDAGDPLAREIRLSSPSATVSGTGEIFDNGVSLGRLAIVNVGNRDALQKAGQNLFGFRAGQDPQLAVNAEAKVHQGALESSNVNVVREMTDMIAATRVFETTQKGLQAYDQMQGKLISEIPKVR
jgi:flagellar basal-body rod protein FlgG